MTKILFVCLGNICRSPMAEFVMKDLVKKAGLASQFHIESAATSREEIGNPVYPPARRIFHAFDSCPFDRVRAVIIGQDPYHEPGQAMGLAFSVPQGERLPPSLRNIFTELHTDLGLPQPSGGDLTPWAERGVLLLNTVLTVGRGAANSHAAWGWQRFTDAVLAAMAALPQPVAFVLWGAQAQKKRPLLQSAAPRLVLCAPHPSPLSSYRGFFGSRPFSQINAFLQENREQPVDWQLP